MPETDPPGLLEFDGVKYIMNIYGSGGQMIEYAGNEAVYDSYIKNAENIVKSSDICTWTGEYYMLRDGRLDHPNVPEYMKKSPYLFGTSPLRFYDADFNLVKTVQFGDVYIRGASYVNGVYYCNIGPYGGGYKASTDLENWENIEAIPSKTGTMTYVLNSSSNEYLVSLNGNDFYKLSSENERLRVGGASFGKGCVRMQMPEKMYISSNNIYDIAICFDKNLSDYAPLSAFYNAYTMRQIYEDGDNLVIDLQNFRLTTPKQPVYDELERLKSAPYVCVNNTILGFEQPPITESDRTLVPMRFLFEQLGAEVTWDGTTETATAVRANKAVAFSIDNTTATVNGAAATMDVPARLVGDKTMVPLRFLSEELGYTVEWDEETRMATISTEDSWEQSLQVSPHQTSVLQ